MKKFISLQVRLMVLIVLMSSILSGVSSCKKTSDVPGANEVFIQGNAFNPSTITVSAGTTVTWTNKDGITHTVTSTGTALIPNSPSIGSNGTFSQLFSTPGTYPYKCTIHPTMTGNVVVN
jgi:plastocyanin